MADTLVEPTVADARSTHPRARVACLPDLRTNPYQRLLYGALHAHDVDLVEGAQLKLGWLLRQRHQLDVLHFHWPEGYYRYRRGPAWLRPTLSWLNLALFAGRVAVARGVGYRVVWTVHQVVPHESAGTIDRVAARLLARLAHALVAHDTHSAEQVRQQLRRAATVIPHGSFVDVYPPGPGRAEARRRLGVEADDVVFLVFGHLRAYKDVDLVLEAWARARLPHRCRLVVAGMPDPSCSHDRLRAAAAADPRIAAQLEFVPDEHVAELYEAADATVVARGDGGTSGALVLALSFGVPAVVGALPTYVELTAGEAGGWTFSPGDAASLADALERAAADVPGREARARRARTTAATLGWEPIAAATARVLAP